MEGDSLPYLLFLLLLLTVPMTLKSELLAESESVASSLCGTSLAEVIEIGMDEEGLMDIDNLFRSLSRLLHQFGAFTCFDFTASHPYVDIDMRSAVVDGYDAITLSPHKFLGRPGSPGILLMNKALYQLKNSPPCTCGTVNYVNYYDEKKGPAVASTAIRQGNTIAWKLCGLCTKDLTISYDISLTDKDPQCKSTVVYTDSYKYTDALMGNLNWHYYCYTQRVEPADDTTDPQAGGSDANSENVGVHAIQNALDRRNGNHLQALMIVYHKGHWPMKLTRRPRGFAFIRFVAPADDVEAKYHTDGCKADFFLPLPLIRFMELLKSYEECVNLSSAIASVKNTYQQTKQVLKPLMEAQSELSLATKSLVICAHKWRKSTMEQTLTTEILTIIVDAILEKPANSEGASTSKEDTPVLGRVVLLLLTSSIQSKECLPTLSSFGRDHFGNTSGSWIAGAVALPMERTFIAIKPDGVQRGLFCVPASTPPHDVIDIMARTIVTNMGAHKNETTNFENEPSSSELAARDTKATAKRPLLPQPSPEAKKKKGLNAWQKKIECHPFVNNRLAYHLMHGNDVGPSIKRRRVIYLVDGVRNFATTSGRGRVKEDLESSTWKSQRLLVAVLAVPDISEGRPAYQGAATRLTLFFLSFSGEDNKLEDEERMWNSIQNGPYQRPIVVDPTNPTVPILEPLPKMNEGNKKQYITDVRVMNYLLQAIPNDIYNSVDAYRNNVRLISVAINTKFLNCLQPEWSKYVTMVRHNQTGPAVSYDVFSYCSFKCFFITLSYKLFLFSQSYYVTHPPSVVDYDNEYQGELQGDSQEDKLTTTMMLIARDGLVDIQTKNAGYSGNANKNAGRNKTQGFNIGNAGHYARECQKPKVRDSKYFREQMLLAMKDEAGSNLSNEENDFMLDTLYGEDLEELTAAAVSQVHASSKVHEQVSHAKRNTIIQTTDDDKIESSIIFDDPCVENNGGTSEHDSTAHDEYREIQMLAYNVQRKAENQKHLNNELKKQKDLLQLEL
ncbi:retrovirus-related pol polyprotein from transposon TNT 1-94 [Tanacetum coccineum]